MLKLSLTAGSPDQSQKLGNIENILRLVAAQVNVSFSVPCTSTGLGKNYAMLQYSMHWLLVHSSTGRWWSTHRGSTSSTWTRQKAPYKRRIVFSFTKLFFIFSALSRHKGSFKKNVFSLYIFGEPAAHFSYFSPLSPLTQVSLQPSAIPGGNPLGDCQSAVGWGDAGFEPGTVGQQSSALPLSCTPPKNSYC